MQKDDCSLTVNRKEVPMLRIALCDDLQDQLEIMKTAVQTYYQNKASNIEIYAYNNAMNFVDAVEERKDFDIILLDICMPGLLGTDIAREMRKQKSQAEIIFLSTSDEFAVEAFDVRAAHYLTKPFTQKQFDQVMDTIRQRHSKKIIFRLVGGGIQVEEVNNLLFIESNGHVQQVHTYDGSMLETRQSLSALLQTFESIVPGQFVSPGKGYIVNQSAIHIIKSEYIEVKGHKIPLAKRKYRPVPGRLFQIHFPKRRIKIPKISAFPVPFIFVRKIKVPVKSLYRKGAKI